MPDKQPILDLESVAPQTPRASPLAGVRVVDLTHFVAGPVCTLMLGDLGADVIKIESPYRGDEFRYYAPKIPGLGDEGAPFQWTSRNKRSIAIDLKAKEGVSIALDLIARADILVENYSTGSLERLGLGYEACRTINPKLIYCSITAYGREGQFADRRGHDPVVQAESGFMSINGYGDRDGIRTGAVVMDISTGFMACSAVLAALYSRQKTGKGQLVESALFDTAITMLGYVSTQFLMSGETPGRFGNTSPDSSPTDVFYAKDRPFYLACSNDRIFDRLASQVLERPDLAEDDRFRNRTGRIVHRAALIGELKDEFGQKTWPEWEPRFRAAGVPAGPVRDVGEALFSAEVQDRKLVRKMPHPTVGWVPYIQMPYRLSETPVVTPVAAPLLGQHTREIMKELNLSDKQIDRLFDEGVVR